MLTLRQSLIALGVAAALAATAGTASAVGHPVSYTHLTLPTTERV